MIGNLVDEARDASAREMFDLLPIDLNLALADVAEGLEQLATPIVGMLKAQISLESLLQQNKTFPPVYRVPCP